MFGSCLARVKEAGGHLTRILWYQVESDAEKPVDEAKKWASRFTGIVKAFRRHLNAPRLPVLFVQIGDRPNGDGDSTKFISWLLIQSMQASVHV
ncbi:sialate O-acetylesterase [Sphingobium sp.]|uniref:sialate O-acetylesterase n=1 Tax=Sphingobium sp. TaxID=1912891 RepID=UPI00262708E2|nr:sialate O-acetylesterase [Sphingobium sp.]